MFTTFTITIISEVMKSKEKLSRNYYRSDVVKFYTSVFMFMLVKKNRKKRKKKKEEKKEEKVGKIVKSNIVKLCIVAYSYCHYTISMD